MCRIDYIPLLRDLSFPAIMTILLDTLFHVYVYTEKPLNRTTTVSDLFTGYTFFFFFLYLLPSSLRSSLYIPTHFWNPLTKGLQHGLLIKLVEFKFIRTHPVTKCHQWSQVNHAIYGIKAYQRHPGNPCYWTWGRCWPGTCTSHGPFLACLVCGGTTCDVRYASLRFGDSLLSRDWLSLEWSACRPAATPPENHCTDFIRLQSLCVTLRIIV